ncbi:thiaminase II [Salipaludibacillus agaradhaerens]|uniref:thiaminase II n=1 Tax=Salipaludibacillus agaradhaerens TaxID=76935 RepID=UPI0021510371|nr:thiaminase II [Salipaludibacillus agaradhaerens]MCR6108197.1 thiaminase II [Salipaludibacillus agaradhaerens]MCR6120222.1 thiaminase II [Salipaludibacillus agaradhaerens]
MSFSKHLYDKLQPIWRKNHDHPFVKELGEGTLSKEKFRFFMIQDYLYLIEYSKLFAIGATKAKDVKTMGEFAKLLDATLNTEMSLHRQYAAKFHISEHELENANPAPTTLAYTHYMLHVGNQNGLAELVASVLPCMWSYAEIGKMLDERHGKQNHDYQEWIDMYADSEFQALASWTINLLDELAAGKPEHELVHLEEIFLTTTKFEYMFWDMAYHGTGWPKGL